MSRWLTVGVGVVYLVIALDHLRCGNGPMALTFFAYALANVGLALAT